MRLLLVVAALLSSGEVPSEQERLDAARATWAEKGSENHRFRVSRSCFCRPEFTRAYDAYVRGGRPYAPVKYVRDIASVPRLFAVVQEAINGEGTFEVSYGATGAPTRIDLDPIPTASNDESLVRASRPREGLFDVAALTIRDGSALRDLREAKARWAKRGLRDYRYRVRISSQVYLEPYTMTARGGKAVSRGPSVRDLFRYIRASIRGEVFDLRVRYARTGQPRYYFDDLEETLADDAGSFRVSRARPL